MIYINNFSGFQMGSGKWCANELLVSFKVLKMRCFQSVFFCFVYFNSNYCPAFLKNVIFVIALQVWFCKASALRLFISSCPTGLPSGGVGNKWMTMLTAQQCKC